MTFPLSLYPTINDKKYSIVDRRIKIRPGPNYYYPIYTISTSLACIKIDEDIFISNFLQNQYPVDVRIEGINDEIEFEIYVDKKTELWVELFRTETKNYVIKTIEIIPSKTLKINTKLTHQQEQKLLVVLKRNIETFAWDYKDMKCIHPSICAHHIYINETTDLLDSLKEG
jgi:hypothetical protein